MNFFRIPFRIILILLGIIGVAVLSWGRVLALQELWTYDLRFQFRPTQKVADAICLIHIDDKTLSELGVWPLPRNFHASLVDVLTELGARAIVFDILFSEPTADDALLVLSLQQSKRVYLPVAFDISDTAAKQLTTEPQKILADIVPSLKSSALGAGQINIIVDADGKSRRVPLFIRQNNKLVPQLALQAACGFLNISCESVEFKNDTVTVGRRLNIPVSGKNFLLVNYPGLLPKTFHHFSYIDILRMFKEMKEGKIPPRPLSFLKDKICFIGLTATGTVDIRPMPLDKNYPMLGLQASVFNSIVTGQYINDAGRFWNTLINSLIFLITLRICLRWKPLSALIGSAALGVLYGVAALILFVFYGWWVDVFLPLALIGVVFVSAACARYWQETRRRELLEKELAIAREIQQSFLPKNFQSIDGVTAAAFLQPAKFVGGDLFDIVRLEAGRVGIMLGDVAGKGVSASLIMAQTISLFRIFAREYPDCGAVLARLNRELSGLLSGRFVTAVYFIVDQARQTLTAASAGQGPLWVWRPAEQKLIEVPLAGSVPLGLMDNTDYAAVNFELQNQDVLIVFSDGLTETRNVQGEEFGLDRIREIIMQNKGKSAEPMLKSLREGVNNFMGLTAQFDDITVMIISVNESVAQG